MIEISFGKLLVLALIALVVLGPEKLPAAARTAGALLRRVRGSWDSVRAEVERELQVDEIRRTAREAVARVDAAQADLDATLHQVREVAQGPAAAHPAQLQVDVQAQGAAGVDPRSDADDTAAELAGPGAVAGTGFALSAAPDAAPLPDAGSVMLGSDGSAAESESATGPAGADTRTGDLFAIGAAAAPTNDAAAMAQEPARGRA